MKGYTRHCVLLTQRRTRWRLCSSLSPQPLRAALPRPRRGDTRRGQDQSPHQLRSVGGKSERPETPVSC